MTLKRITSLVDNDVIAPPLVSSTRRFKCQLAKWISLDEENLINENISEQNYV